MTNSVNASICSGIGCDIVAYCRVWEMCWPHRAANFGEANTIILLLSCDFEVLFRQWSLSQMAKF